MEFLVYVKAYLYGGRISVNEIQGLALRARERGARGILVTTGQLTSVAQQVLDRVNSTNTQLQVLDGLALRQMLLANPDLAQKHLGVGIPDKGSR
jgi:restriction endonuclease Mrr